MKKLFCFLIMFDCLLNISLACSQQHPFPMGKLLKTSEIVLFAKIKNIVVLKHKESYQVTLEVIKISQGELADKIVTITLYYKENWKGFAPSQLYVGQEGQFFLNSLVKKKKSYYSGYARIYIGN